MPCTRAAARPREQAHAIRPAAGAGMPCGDAMRDACGGGVCTGDRRRKIARAHGRSGGVDRRSERHQRARGREQEREKHADSGGSRPHLIALTTTRTKAAPDATTSKAARRRLKYRQMKAYAAWLRMARTHAVAALLPTATPLDT